MTDRMHIIIPLVIYLAMAVALAFWTRKYLNKSGGKGNFLEEYFIGGRSMGGFVLAMSIVASYTSASSFVGGPGAAYSLGLGWVLLAMVQTPTTFLILGVLGKRFAIVARRAGILGFADFLRARYKNETLVLITSVAVIIFFIAAIVAQFIGGARLFQAITGYSYLSGLTFFGVTVIFYTSFGGFRATAITDAIQGVVMLVAGVLIFVAVVHAGGGIESCMLKLRDIDPGLLTPEGPGGKIPQPFILSFWILVGLGTLGLPHTAQKCIGYKDTKSLHNAMIIGTFAIGFMILLMHLTGALGRAVIQDLPAGDLAMPTMTIQLLHPVLVGIFVAGPLAAIMSTVDSMLLLSCATLVNDIYVHHVLKGKPESVPPQRIRGLSFITTAVLGVLVFVAAIEPPDLLVWINLFAFGGMEAAFLWPLVLGLYWKKANAAGALASVIAGVGCYFAIVLFKIPIWGMHAIVPTALVGFVAFVLGTRFGQKPDPDTVRIFAEDV